MKFEEIHQERKKSVVDDNVDIFSKRRRSSVKIETSKVEDLKKTKAENDKIRKIRQMVDFDENSMALSTHQKNMYGIVEEK